MKFRGLDDEAKALLRALYDALPEKPQETYDGGGKERGAKDEWGNEYDLILSR
jgi:hypothetical protein